MMNLLACNAPTINYYIMELALIHHALIIIMKEWKIILAILVIGTGYNCFLFLIDDIVFIVLNHKNMIAFHASLVNI